MKLSQTCESAGFHGESLYWTTLPTIDDVNDGFGGKTGSCRACTLPCDALLDWFVDTRRSFQSAKSESPVVLTNMELRYRCRPCRKNGSCFWIVISRGPNRYVDESWQDQEDLPRDVEMVSSTAVEQPHAITSSIEETHKPSDGREA